MKKNYIKECGCMNECGCQNKQEDVIIDVSKIIDSQMLYKKYIKVTFENSTGKKINLYVPKSVFTNWMSSAAKKGSALYNFTKDYLSSGQQINEIVDEFGDLIGDNDEGNNSTNAMVGNSKFGSDKTIRQTIAKVKTYDANMGRGIITW
jgi:hypothetical protein